MEPASTLSPTPPPITASAKTTASLRKAGLDIPPAVSCLVLPSAISFQSLPDHADQARALLVQQRITDPKYRHPNRQVRDIFRGSEKKREIRDSTLWTFSKHEVACTFNQLLSRTPLVHPGVAQAVLSHASVASLHDLWPHLDNPKLEKKQKDPSKAPTTFLAPGFNWLDHVAAQGNLDYIRLMHQAGLLQPALDRAFAMALERHAMDVMELLLASGAVASGCQDRIRELFQKDDIALASLLLSAPTHAMSISAWHHCLGDKIAEGATQPPSLLLLCLANRPSIVCGPLLLRALDSRNFQAAAALLALADQESRLSDVAQSACELASKVEDVARRLDFYMLLADSGLIVDSDVARKELMIDVKGRHLLLVQLLVGAGVVLDLEPYNAVAYAVTQMDFNLLESLKKGKFHTTAALALNFAPKSAAELELLRLIEILEPQGLHGEPLDTLLIRAARKKESILADRLLNLGASVEYQKACAIRASLAKADFSMLKILLRGPCSATALSSTLPVALNLQRRHDRRKAFEALIEKGVVERELGVSLQSLMAERGDIDLDLVHFLLQRGAPANDVTTTRAVMQAARICHVPILSTLCGTGPTAETLSNAVPVAFRARQVCGYQAALEAITLLLERGAAGIAVHETLLAAAIEDDQFEIVRVLVKHGADANFANATALEVAIQSPSLKLLEIICSACSPTQNSIECVIYTAIDPENYKLDGLNLLLRSSKSVGRALDRAWDTARLRENPNFTAIIPCFLKHGMSVDLHGGLLPCFAIRESNIPLLRSILLSRPSVRSLATAFEFATGVSTRDAELETTRLLLESAQSSEIGQSSGLLRQTHFACRGDFAGLKLLLRHKADVDFDNGIAVRVAASTGNFNALYYLLECGPAVSTLHRACLDAAKSDKLSDSQRHAVLECLLNARDRELTEANHMSRLMNDCIAQLPEHTELPLMLIARGVNVRLDTLMVAARSSPRQVFLELTHGQPTSAVTEVFKKVRRISMHSERKSWIYEILLKSGISGDETSRALVECLQTGQLDDLSFPEMLLQHGARVGYKKCASFGSAFRADSLKTVQLLSTYIRDDHTACVAFDIARTTTTISPNLRAWAYSSLLKWNIKATSINSALLSSLEGRPADLSVVQLLVAKGADPNQDAARCFTVAAKPGNEYIFRVLSKVSSLSKVLRVLIDLFSTEREVLVWFNKCLEEQHHLAKIEDDQLLYQCMKKFPAGKKLLNVMLDRGVSPTVLGWRLVAEDGLEREECTPLIWALLAKPKISSDIILTLLDRGGHEARPLYSTPRSCITAGFACIIDKSRTPVLEALLKLDPDGVLECSTPISTFRRFSMGKKELVPDENDGLPSELPMRSACVMLGNFDAYRALNCEEIPNDGNLHTAALMALPSFIKWLLNFHDPNEKLPEFDQMIPLALACTPRTVPWCRVAMEEGDLATRRNECIKLLAPRTDTKWRYRNKTVLHIALENGLEVTKTMLEALGILHDAQRNDRYIYQDKSGIEYSPDEYVLKIMTEMSDREKITLVKCLRKNGITSHYFRRIMPREGEQPAGYHGLPIRFAKAWEDYEKKKVNDSRRAEEEREAAERRKADEEREEMERKVREERERRAREERERKAREERARKAREERERIAREEREREEYEARVFFQAYLVRMERERIAAEERERIAAEERERREYEEYLANERREDEEARAAYGNLMAASFLAGLASAPRTDPPPVWVPVGLPPPPGYHMYTLCSPFCTKLTHGFCPGCG
ncbi:hypothetical protein EJ04DRAFT_272997 [Polyplosphaeria fusca]|uniref:Ankyrin repeat protein n=1 Tax=Polyplosphaeria fusca TaxID=682080 RepID=A0A9P4QY29_9PLEO|nr:hypothetical protein EJ04DRAFT_272997 [Polyplosphaeria fusca]